MTTSPRSASRTGPKRAWTPSRCKCGGTDRCNGIDPRGYRPGYALQWALLEDVFNGDERSEVIAEVAAVFGNALADRLAVANPPPHRTLCRRLGRSPFLGIVAFSRWALGDVSNDIIWTWTSP